MGTSITEKQISSLKRVTRNMVLAVDADNAGEEAMLRCVGYENSLDTEVRVVVLPGGKDPDDVIKEDAKTWQHLLENAFPVVDYTFNMITSKLDLTIASGKSQARDELIPIAAEIKDSTRQDHYLTRLSELTGTSYHNLETALTRIKADRRAKKPKSEAVARAVHPLHSSPLEEYCLTLLLQHPKLKNSSEDPLPEYFENSENREIFIAWQQANDLPSLKDKLDTAIWEHLDALVNKSIPTNQIEQKYADCVLRLREKALRGLEAQRAELLTLEVELGGTGADLAKLKDEGIETSTQLLEVQKARRAQEQRR